MSEGAMRQKSVIKKRFPWGWAVLGLLAMVVIGGFFASKNAPVNVSTTTPTVFKAGERNPLVTASGYVVARVRATLSSKVLGRVAWLGVQEGSRVKKGQILAVLESNDLQASRDQVAVELAQSEIDLNRAESLFKEGIQDKATVDQLRAKRDALKAQITFQDATLGNNILRAPFDGVVTQKLSEVGETVAPGSAGGMNAINAILVMADFRTLEVEVEVNEASIAKLKVGMPAEIRVDALEGGKGGARVLKGRIRVIYPSSNRQKAVIIVRVAILDPDPLLVPDMGAKVTFLGEPFTENVIVLGREQVVKREGQSFTWAVDKGQAVLLPVLIHNENPIGLEVTGINADTQLIVAPPENLKVGAKVTVKAK